jgi:hypothetical protein
MRLAKVLLLIFALLVLTELFLVFRPEPAVLTAGVPLGDAAITDLLRKRFPIGSPAAALEDELKQEGNWGSIHVDRAGRSERFWHYVQLRRRIGLFTPELTTIIWEVDEAGLLTNVHGSKFIDITYP